MATLGKRWKLERPRKSRPQRPLMDRFLANVSPEPNCGCWLWAGSCDGWGRAKFKTNASTVAARTAYELFCGSIPGGFSVLHRCDMPACVNPEHLFLGTLQDNMDDRNAKGRHAHGERHGKARLTEVDVLAIRASSESDSALADRYGRATSTIQQARSGRCWKHL